jgi:tetratricopeptide (TPR) repeat protein
LAANATLKLRVRQLREQPAPEAAPETVHSVDMKELAESIRRIKQAWKDKDYATTANESRKVLKWEPGNVYGLLYLARAAAYTGDWRDVAETGALLVRHSPRDAFNAARKLNRAGLTLDAARIFGELQVHEEWFDKDVAELAAKEGGALFKAGQAAEKQGDHGLAKTLWVAGARIAPSNELLRDRIRQLASQALNTAKDLDRNADPIAYANAWREVLALSPSNIVAATKLAWAHERLNPQDAIDAWLKVLASAPDHEKALERLWHLAVRHNLEYRTIRGLVELGRDEATDPLIQELAKSRDAKARESHEKIVKLRLREALRKASAIDRDAEPRSYLAAWKDVLVLDPSDLGAAKKVLGVARQLGDHSEQVEGLIALLEITPNDSALKERLMGAARRAGHEQRALDYLVDRGLTDLPQDKVESLRKRLLSGCKNALGASDLDAAMASFRTLVRVDGAHPSISSLRPSVLKKAVTTAWDAEKEGNLAVAVPLAEQILEIAPDQPVALKIVARDLLRHERYQDLIALCQPHVKPGPEYEAVRKLLERASAKLSSDHR